MAGISLPTPTLIGVFNVGYAAFLEFKSRRRVRNAHPDNDNIVTCVDHGRRIGQSSIRARCAPYACSTFVAVYGWELLGIVLDLLQTSSGGAEKFPA